jgi:hypothetical protein
MSAHKDPVETIVLKFVVVFIIGILVYFLVSPSLSLFGLISTGNTFFDVIFLKVIPLCIVFFVIYRIFKVFSA